MRLDRVPFARCRILERVKVIPDAVVPHLVSGVHALPKTLDRGMGSRALLDATVIGAHVTSLPETLFGAPTKMSVRCQRLCSGTRQRSGELPTAIDATEARRYRRPRGDECLRRNPVAFELSIGSHGIRETSRHGMGHRQPLGPS